MKKELIYYEMQVADDNGKWFEKMEGYQSRKGKVVAPDTDKLAIMQANIIVDQFNATLHEFEKERSLQGLRKVKILTTYKKIKL
ncbi:MAG: hypothetical protein ACUZ8H_01560 [Candidatus Anammoxibacter sp.]